MRSLPEAVCRIGEKAGVTLEAAMVLPLFLFFVLNLFSVMEMLRVYGNMAWAMNIVGGKLSVYGYVYEQATDDADISLIGELAFSYLYFKEEIIDILGEDYLNESPIVNGSDGILFTKTQIMDNGLIELVVTYEMKMPFGMGEIGKIRVFNSYQGRAWTGYKVSEEGVTVYLAEQGSVYHVFRDCSYLDIQPQKVTMAQIPILRNDFEERYRACDLCGNKSGDEAWITRGGSRYHKKEDCYGIVRSCLTGTLEEVESKGYKMCSKCKERKKSD